MIIDYNWYVISQNWLQKCSFFFWLQQKCSSNIPFYNFFKDRGNIQNIKNVKKKKTFNEVIKLFEENYERSINCILRYISATYTFE